ncbi:MAG: aspartate kinase [Cyclobacteriaceae bacterium]|nr:aspartate kinase [Cyclobacteriaceae bacterium]
MNIFKFGGASLKNSERINNVAEIISSHAKDPLLVVVSAMGKTTDALEKIASLASARADFRKELEEIKTYHLNICQELFQGDHFGEEINTMSLKLTDIALAEGEVDFVYDQIVSFGELISSAILTAYLKYKKFEVSWIDSRQYIKTDDTFREGKIDWMLTEKNIATLANTLGRLTVTQGFIGSTERNETTTLGREGSDFTAAIYGSCLGAKSVTIWKDVPGVMSADPRRIPTALVFDELPYKEAAEMTYFGASVIHPKTIKPLANRQIPLLVKSFIDPMISGTKIHDCRVQHLPPLVVYKENQCLISCKVTDYTFVDEIQMTTILKALSDLNLKINVMQNSAISFSFCIDYTERKVLKLINVLSKQFEVYYNANLTLITIKNYDAVTSSAYRTMKGVILEQSSRSTLQVLVKL